MAKRLRMVSESLRTEVAKEFEWNTAVVRKYWVEKSELKQRFLLTFHLMALITLFADVAKLL